MTMAKPQSRHFSDLLDEITERDPSKEFLVSGDSRLSYGEFRERAEATARGLYAMGVRRGDRIAVLVSNRTEWMEIAFGAFQLGAILAPLSTWSRAWDLGYTLRHSGAKLLVTLPEFHGNVFLDYLRELAPDLGSSSRDRLQLEDFPALERVVVVGSEAGDGMWSSEEMLAAGEGVEDSDLAAVRADLTPDDLAYILYTSGTTADPKGVMVAHGNCVENAFLIGERQHQTSEDRLWLAVSLGWGFAAMNALPAILSHGGTLVMQEDFDAAEALRLFEAERITVVYGMPNIVDALLAHPDSATADRSTLRTGAMIGTPEQLRVAIEDLGVSEMCNIYGSTETYGNSCVTDAHEPAEMRMISQGPPVPGHRIRIVDPVTREELPAGEVGEVVVGGRICPGYWNAPEQNAAAFKDGEYLSGDAAYLDEEGRFFYSGRFKEMIKTGGINVAPPEVEAFLATHELIREASVVGMPDESKSEIIHAVLRLEPGADVDTGELRTYCKERIASYKIPARFTVLEADFPRTTTGKVNKNELREQLLAGEI
ncbi:MAG TPA: AMP-binding protein [Solirubrobacterales bacterium]|nr:AMP-binding protein [Solirubrobacterales bacterium]